MRRRRHVWIVNHYAFPPDQPAGARHFHLARELIARGDDVTIFAAGFSHFSGHDERLRGHRWMRIERYEGVRFVWLWTVPYRGNTVRRQVNMLSFLLLFVVAQATRPRPDVIVGSTVHPFAALGAWIASRLRCSRFVFEIRDLWPQTLVDLGALRAGSPGERVLRALEAFLVRQASVVVTLLPGMTRYLAEHGLPTHHVVYVPNGVDVAAFAADNAAVGQVSREVADNMQAVERLRADGRFVVGYIGMLGLVNRIDVVIRAAVAAERREPGRIGLLVVGDGPARPALEALAVGQECVAFGPPIPHRSVAGVLRALDAAVVHATATPIYRYGISFNKLFEYMAAGRPVVFACGSAYDPVAAVRAGISLEPDDPERLADAFLEIADMPGEDLAAMGAAGRGYVIREHAMATLGERFAQVIEGRVGPSERAVS